MTDKLKCCFCGAELEDDWYEYENGHGDTEYAKSGLLKCSDWDCRGYKLKLEPEIWQALIQAKQDLEITRKALEVATDFIGFVNTSRHADGALAAMAICKLNEITSITKQENK